MPNFTNNRINPTFSLSTQINDAEQQVQNGKHKISVATATIVKKAKQQMTSPTSLLVASVVGFMLGEITKHPSPKILGTDNKPGIVETSPLRIALNLVTSIQTLYTSLPVAWMIKIFKQSAPSGSTSGQPS
jgi:hypothetical protein